MDHKQTKQAMRSANEQLQKHQDPNALIGLYLKGKMTSEEVFSQIVANTNGEHLAEVIEILNNNKDVDSHQIAKRLKELHELENKLVFDVVEIEKTSKMYPGCRVRLSGSYDSGDWWLNGQKYLAATLIRFVSRKSKMMPIAALELDHPISMTESDGLRHNGNIALAKLRFVESWMEEVTVTIHIVDKIPQDIDAFYDSHPFGTEIESHVKLNIISDSYFSHFVKNVQ